MPQSTMSSGLTEDQKRKIEENRRKALAKRAERLGHAPQSATASTAGVAHSSKQYNQYKVQTPQTNQYSKQTSTDVDGVSRGRTTPNSAIGGDKPGSSAIGGDKPGSSAIGGDKPGSSAIGGDKPGAFNDSSYQNQSNFSTSSCNVGKTVIGPASSHLVTDSNGANYADRIEQNRQKALAKRAIRSNQSPHKGSFFEAPLCSSNKTETGQTVSCVQKNSYNLNDQSRLSEPSNVATQKSNQFLNSSNIFSTASTSNRYSDAPSSSSRPAAESSSTVQSANQPAWNAFGGVGNGPVKGSCMLIARDRFEVNVGYCVPLVHLFKTMETKMYDAVSKRWSFKLSEYHKFMRAVQTLKPTVDIEPLPKALLQAFAGLVRGDDSIRSIPIADLSNVEPSLVNSLMSFQREGVNFGVYKNGRVLIADDMGLGKTIQAICLVCYYRKEWPLLIVVPSSVRFDWAQQLRRWVPSLDPQSINVVVSGKESCTSGLINILSYDLMSRNAEQLKQKRFQVVIMDECHLLKNYKTARCKAAMPLMQNAKRVILLSGTPALSRPLELYTQISAVCPFMFKHHDFGVRYCDGKKFPWGWDFNGSSNMTELQLLLEEKIMIRRLKSEVLTELPDKVRQMVLLDPNTVRINKDLKSASTVFTKGNIKRTEQRGLLLEFFHKSGEAKLKAVKSYVEDLLEEEGKKFIIFAHHAVVLDGIEDTVKAKVGSNYMRIDGNTNPEQRNFFCKKFQHNDDMRTAILSITAANAGLDLSAATLVVFAELFWNPGILVQAEDRAHRIGQHDCVNVQYLVATGTSDDHIWPMIQEKLDVLSKAGLTKDNFSSAETTTLLDPKQKQITKFLEESFAEDLFVGEMDDTETDKGQLSEAMMASSSPVEQSSTAVIARASSPVRQSSETVMTRASSPLKRSSEAMMASSSPVQRSSKTVTTRSSPVKRLSTTVKTRSPFKHSSKTKTNCSSPVKHVVKQQSILKYVSPIKNTVNSSHDTYTPPKEMEPSTKHNAMTQTPPFSTVGILTDTNLNRASLPVPCSTAACDDELEAFLMDSDDDFGEMEPEPSVKKKKVVPLIDSDDGFGEMEPESPVKKRKVVPLMDSDDDFGEMGPESRVKKRKVVPFKPPFLSE